MLEFFSIHKTQIISVTVVVAIVLVLHFLTNTLNKWLVKREQEKYPGESPNPFNLIKRILNALWLVLGAIALALIFVESDKSAVLVGNFKLIFYLGIVSVITIVLATSTNMWFKKSVRTKILNNDDPTAYKFLRYVAVFAIYFTGILLGLLAFPSLRGVSQTALGGAGVLALIAGVASQEALSNLVGGVFIISFKPFKIGDVINVSEGMTGTVTDITLRHTVIRNFENKMIVIPNAVINKEKLVNYSLGELKCCEMVEIGISYDSDVSLAKKIMQEECEKHPLILDNRSDVEKKEGKPLVKTALTKLNDSSVTIRAWAWARTFGDAFMLKCDVLESIKARFEDAGVEIPFPYRTLVMKNEMGEQPIGNKHGSQTENI
ncbi:mechanosensitive ion channel family protein [Cryomorpha ignava]|uniref:Mechanosensitive ion channel family protein n=1 Tax=Cryomorpha ignava TaxID=101383 RepID=A0A7K3WXW8_9FLAO|nr:mechanosensitive ion channel family protein [Cryomorpha ignava]NEN25712.1 mechanosensitive ion channel family protein [Cryomorpha ignava]